MEQKQNHNLNNYKAVGIGFLMIAAVALLTFLRPSFYEENKNASEDRSENPDNYKSVSAKDLLSKMNDEETVIIDLRDADSFKAEHIAGSANLNGGVLASAISRMDKNKEYFLVDNVGITPSEIQAMDVFSQNGFKNVAYLEAGISGWKNNFNPLISAGDPYSFSDQAKVIYIKSEELKKLMQRGDKLYIIDVRKPDSFSNGHIKDAVNIFLDDLESRKNDIPLGRKIILYDNDGLWAFQGAVRLFDMGITNVFTLSDGLDAWKEKGYETTL